jgi:RecA-family ATPase
VRGLGCCVRLICHVSKEAARSGALDQYASRGGSALADGARMVAVLRSWDPEATDDKLTPPPNHSGIYAIASRFVYPLAAMAFRSAAL